MEVTETLKLIGENWFLTEPAYFALYCKQQLQENVNMECAVRCGKGRIEYNPLILKHKNYHDTEQLMRIELIRLYLKHPYERRPEGCGGRAIAIGSDITIADGYCTLRNEKLPLQTPDFYHLPLGQYYEWYAKKLQQESDKGNNDDNDSNNQDNGQSGKRKQNNNSQSLQDKSELWEDDSLQCQRINQLIEQTSDWGTMPADIVERIQASTQAHLHNSFIWQGFHGAILKSQRKLTRMRPNRRTGFLQMGSTRQFDTHLLVAIDVSGSIDEAMLSDFYSTINRLFRHRQVEIDLCQFDMEMGAVEPMNRTHREVEIKGRGGTSFQPVIDYISSQKKYDGLLILTDGKAPAPVLPPHWATPLLWVCHNRECYDQNKDWMRKSGRCCHL